MKNRLHFKNLNIVLFALLAFLFACTSRVDAKIVNNDAGISAILSDSSNTYYPYVFAEAQLKNYGKDTLKSCMIYWKVNGQLESYLWQGILETDSTITIYSNYGPFFSKKGIDTITVWTDSANGVYDSVPGNDTAKAIINVILCDTLPPILRVMCSGNTDTVQAKTYFSDPIPCEDSDNVDGLLTPDSMVGYVNINKLGLYKVIYYSSDVLGNMSTDTLNVLVIDTIAPVISLIGRDTLESILDSPYTDLGATVIDTYWVHVTLIDSTDINIHKAGYYHYTYYAEDSSGNKAIPVTRTVLVKSGGNVTANFSVADTVCAYVSVSFTNTSLSNYCGIDHWLWAYGDGTTDTVKDPTHTYNTAGSYAVKLIISTSGGCTDSFTKKIFVDSTCVWPGDANNNKVVDTNDVLQIGIVYGATGPKRANVSTTWKGQYCINWGFSYYSGIDVKYADCNGDGVIDSNDIKAVGLNYGDIHSKTGANKTGSPTDAPLYLAFNKTSYNPGDTVEGAIMLGNNTNSLSNVYGLEAAFSFSPANVDTNTIKVSFTKSWFGAPGTDLFSFVHNEYTSGELLFAITRIDHNNTSGNGSIGTVSFVISQNASAGKVNFTVGSSKLISFDEKIVPLYLPTDTFVVTTTTGIQNQDNVNLALKISPNPFTFAITISYTLPQNQNVLLTLTDITGKQIATLANETQNPGQHIYTFDADKYNIPAGMYFLQLVAGNAAVEQKIVRIR